jgi:bifunctional non-homologous end joining protein LigD
MIFEPQLAKMGSLVDRAEPLRVPAGCVAERKWDGMRAIFEVADGQTKIFSRTGGDLREAFPELTRLHEVIPSGTILDGEIVVLDADGVESLEALQPRIHAQGQKAIDRSRSNPATIRFFDVLSVRGIDVRSLSLRKRQAHLFELVGPDFVVAESVRNGEFIPAHWEGVVIKREDSPYSSGKRNADWLKVKFVNRATLRAVSLTPGTGARSSSFGAIVVEDANGVPRGQVGSGFKQADLDLIMAADAAGIRLLIEVEYRFIGKNGLLVNTAFKGVRDDKEVADVL